jgi:hypothetical protein
MSLPVELIHAALGLAFLAVLALAGAVAVAGNRHDNSKTPQSS